MRLLKRVGCKASEALIVALVAGTLVSSARAGDIQEQVDQAFDQVHQAVGNLGLERVISIDHARLGADAGSPMPPARVQLFSDPALNSRILAGNIRAGLDLPFRVLAYDAGGALAVSYTNASYFRIRHGGADDGALMDFDAALRETLDTAGLIGTASPTAGLVRDYGILELTTERDFNGAIAGLRDVVMAQSDTIWFGELDFQFDASQVGINLPRATLLLFGGPAPGGIAMADFPGIGLDAFCQKLLVYEDADGVVKVIYNDIAALAMLQYGDAIDVHHGLNKRLTETFQRALQ